MKAVLVSVISWGQWRGGCAVIGPVLVSGLQLSRHDAQSHITSPSTCCLPAGGAAEAGGGGGGGPSHHGWGARPDV